MKTATNKTTKRIENIKANNERRKEESKVKILETITNEENPVNKKATECISILKETKDKNNEQFTNSIYQLSSIIIQSKLKHIQNDDKKYREQTAKLKSNLGILFHHSKNESENNVLKRNVYIKELNNLYVTSYNKNGEQRTICTDSKREQKILKELENLTKFEEAEELLQDIACKLWTYIEKELENVSFDYSKLKLNALDNCLLKEFEIVKLHTTVYKNGHEKPVELWEKTYTNAIKESTKEISRNIESKKAKQENTIAYEEIETTIYNPYEEREETVKQYHKVPKIAIVDDTDGKQTADINTIRLIENILAKAKFTFRQAYIFKMYFCENWSITELADKMKVKRQYIVKELANIKQKAIDTRLFESIGYTEEKAVDNSKKAQKIACYDVTNEQNKIFVCFFESLGNASKSLSVDKGNISKVLKGQRKQVNGFCFEYVTE